MTKSRVANTACYVVIGVMLCYAAASGYHSNINDRLRRAVTENNEPDVLALLRRGADPNFTDAERWNGRTRVTVLTEAVQDNERLGIIEALLSHGANPNPIRSRGDVPLTRAITIDRPDILKVLLDHGAKDVSADYGPATHLASRQPSKECYRLLREHGFPTTIHDAARIGALADVIWFLDRGMDVNVRNSSANSVLIVAVGNHQRAIVKLLMSRGVDLNSASRFWTPLGLAQQVEDREIAALLRANGAHLSLVEAIRFREVDMVRERIKAGDSVNAQHPDIASGRPAPDNAPIFLAVASQNLSIVQYLLDANVIVPIRSMNGQTPLMRAAQRGNTAIVRALLARSGDLNLEDNFNNTAMYYACLNDHPEIYRILKGREAAITLFDAAAIGDVELMRQLVQRGANINAPNRDGNTPLMLAAVRGKVDAIHTLIDLGATIDGTTTRGETALLKVAWSEHVESVRALLDRGADPNAHSPTGRTPIMRAAEAGRIEILRALLAKGGDLTATSAKGDTALKLAVERRHPEAAALLRDAGASE